MRGSLLGIDPSPSVPMLRPCNIKAAQTRGVLYPDLILIGALEVRSKIQSCQIAADMNVQFHPSTSNKPALSIPF